MGDGETRGCPVQVRGMGRGIRRDRRRALPLLPPAPVGLQGLPPKGEKVSGAFSS